MALRINKLVVVGVGLIGGSFALALRRAGVVGEVVGLGRSPGNLERAVALGVIDAIGASPAAALAGADLVLLAMPVGQTAAVMASLAPYLDAATVVTDAGSTKQDVIDAARNHLSAHLRRFVPAHPIAGAEQSGVEAASADLFRGRKTVIAALPESDTAAVTMVKDAWTACGAVLHEMTAPEHDAVFAAVSHLPHVLAFALVQEVAAHDNAGQLFDFAAGGFRDFTRIASSHPEMWRDICVANRRALGTELERYRGALARVQELIDAGDADALERLFADARAARDAWLARGKGPGK